MSDQGHNFSTENEKYGTLKGWHYVMIWLLLCKTFIKKLVVVSIIYPFFDSKSTQSHTIPEKKGYDKNKQTTINLGAWFFYTGLVKMFELK